MVTNPDIDYMMAKTPEREKVIISRKIGIVETTPDRQKEVMVHATTTDRPILLNHGQRISDNS